MNAETVIKQYETSVERRKLLLGKLIEQRNQIDAQIQNLVGDMKAVATERQPRAAGHSKFQFPRGVITLAAFEVLAASKKPLTFDQVLEGVKTKKGIDAENPNLRGSLYNILNASPRFKKINGGFAVAEKQLTGKLFERLESELAMAS